MGQVVGRSWWSCKRKQAGPFSVLSPKQSGGGQREPAGGRITRAGGAVTAKQQPNHSLTTAKQQQHEPVTRPAARGGAAPVLAPADEACVQKEYLETVPSAYALLEFFFLGSSQVTSRCSTKHEAPSTKHQVRSSITILQQQQLQ
jgi:hypothetical protein